MQQMLKLAVISSAFALATSSAFAINKCTGPDGRTTYQDGPCPSGGTTIKPVVPQTSGGGSREPNPALQGPPEAAPLLALYKRWIDAEKLASATGRIAMAQPVAALQSLARESVGTNVPPCMRPAQSALTSLIKGSAEAMLKFMGKEELRTMVYTYVDRKRMVAQFEDAVGAAKCSP